MPDNSFYIDRCKQLIEEKVGWGDSKTWRTKDFENLSIQIFEKSGVSLSTSTLRRMWGRADYPNQPSLATLDALASFAGFANWRMLQKDLSAEAETLIQPLPPQKLRYSSWRGVGTALIVLVTTAALVILGLKFAKQKELPESAEFVFKVKRMTNGIPNTVIFDYHIPASVNDSVYIQQSWDSTKRIKINSKDHTHTAIYYEPGIHHAKLIIGNRTVKEEMVTIPTPGWIGLIENKDIPVYLKPTMFQRNQHIALEPEELIAYHTDMATSPRYVQFCNVGNFAPIPLANFSFSSDIKHGFGEGAAACQFSYIMLYTDGQNPILIPLSQKGCISKLNLLTPDTVVSGSNHNLSGFGTDLSEWTRVSCEVNDNVLRFSVNGSKAYEMPFDAKKLHIRGVGYFFKGTGAARNLVIKNDGKVRFQDLTVSEKTPVAKSSA